MRRTSSTPRMPHPAACLMALLLASAAVWAQHQSPMPDRRPVQPFAFERKDLNPRSLEFGREQVRAYADAVTRHIPGRADASAERYAWVVPSQLETLVAAFETTVERMPPTVARTDLLKRAVLLHTDIGIMVDVLSSRADRINAGPVASLHLGAALDIVEMLRREGSEGPHDRFALDWWRAVAALLGSRQEMMSAPLFMERAVRLFPHDADILLLAGGVHELIASSVIQDPANEAARDIRDAHGGAGDNLARAEQYYREAQASDPTLDEARVRHARVLLLRGHREPAVAELDGKIDAIALPSMKYFAYLFLGQAHEELNHPEAARAAYRHAIEIFPGAESASLALARLEHRDGDKAGSIAVVGRLLGRPPEERSDPWLRYFTTGPAHRSAQMLEALRAPFRR